MTDSIPSGTEWGLRPLAEAHTDYADHLHAYSDQFDVINRMEWHPFKLDHFVWHIFAQIDGMCTSNATVQCLMVVREMMGLPRALLSPESLYDRVGNWGTGSTLPDNLEQITEVGVCTRADVPQENWRRRQWPDNWEERAKSYRVLEWWQFRGGDPFSQVASAIQRGFVCNIGLRWPGGGGHSVCVTSLKKAGGTWILRGPNSWGANWGDNGFFELTERQCNSMDRFGAFACRAAVYHRDDDGEPSINSGDYRC